MTILYEAGNYILLRTDHSDPGTHCHMAAHILIALETAMTVVSGGETWECRSVLIPAGTPHRTDTHGGAVLVFLFDSTTNVAARITEVRTLPEPDREHLTALYARFAGDGSADVYEDLERQLLAALGLDAVGCTVTDGRILTAMERIRSGLTEPLRCRDVASSVFLSPSRFSHLFRLQTGMTFAAYVVYQRLVHVYARILEGASITEAALEAGFASSAHFADVNRRVFGLPAGSLTKNMAFFKIK